MICTLCASHGFFLNRNFVTIQQRNTTGCHLWHLAQVQTTLTVMESWHNWCWWWWCWCSDGDGDVLTVHAIYKLQLLCDIPTGNKLNNGTRSYGSHGQMTFPSLNKVSIVKSFLMTSAELYQSWEYSQVTSFFSSSVLFYFYSTFSFISFGIFAFSLPPKTHFASKLLVNLKFSH